MRFKEEGESGLEDRSSCLHTFPYPPPEMEEKILTMWKEGKMTGDRIARELNIPQRTVSRHLSQANYLGKMIYSLKTKSHRAGSNTPLQETWFISI